MTEARRQDAIALAILAVLATILFWDVLVGTHNFYMRDLTRYYYPTKQILREIVQQGEFPWWNRQFGAGQPIAANPEHEVFYPLTWLILLPSFDLGYRLHILVHIYIGLFGMYALLRSMRTSAPTAAFGAISFALGGIYLSYINLLPILFCAAWLPLTCLFARRFMLAPSLRNFALSSLLFGLQLLVGEPTTVAQTGFLLGMYALYRGWYKARDEERSWRAAIPEMLARVGAVGMISVAAMAVGAAQFLSALDHVGDSARSRTFDFSLVGAWSMPWAKLAETIYPNFLGHLSIDQVMWYWGGGLYPGMGSPFLFSIYPGLLCTALAAAAFFVRPRGGVIVLLISLFSLLVALGSHTPLLRMLYDAGIATSVRYPEKFILMAVFASILLAAKLFERLIVGDEAVRDAMLGFLAATVLVAAAIWVAGFTPKYSAVFKETWGMTGDQAKRMIEFSRTGWMIAAIRGAALFALIWFARSLPRRVIVLLLLAFVAADLGPVVHQLNPRMPSRFFLDDPPVLTRFAGDRKSYRIFHEADWYGQEQTARKYFSTGRSVYWIVRNGLFPMTPAGYGLSMVIDRDYDKTALLPTIDFVQSVWDVKRSGREDWWQTFMAMSNARYRGVYRTYEAEKKRVGGRMENAEPIDFTFVADNPRYYFSDQIVSITGRPDFVSRLSDGSYSRRVAFVKIPSFTPGTGTVHRATETANSAVLDVEVAGRGFLVMSVTPHKYWEITIDGTPAEAVITNIGFQGVVVPAGRHRVVMRYRNPVAERGMAVSVTAILALAGATLWRRRGARP